MSSVPNDPWAGWSGQWAHPDSPAGGGGPGRFRQAGITDAWATVVPVPTLPPLQVDLVRSFGGMALPAPQAAPKAADFGVRDLPGVMRTALNWPFSAAVMDLWFAKPARAMSPAEKQDASLGPLYPLSHTDASLFTMKWLQGFERVDAALQSLKATLNTPNARKVLAALGAGLPDGPGSSAGLAMPQLHARHQFQFASVGYTSELDDLYGSLGNFGLYAALLDWQVTGQASKGNRQLQVGQVALYMRDTFDFIGGQYLGHWNRQGMCLVAGAGLAGLVDEEAEWHLPAWNPSLGWMSPVNNSDFRAWRDNHQCGGDLLLFSDLLVHPVDLRVPL